MLETPDCRARASRPPSEPGRRRHRYGQDGRRRARLPPAAGSRWPRSVAAVRRAPRGDPPAVAGAPTAQSCATARSGRSTVAGPIAAGSARLRDGPVAARGDGWSSSTPRRSTCSSSTSSTTPRPTTYDRLLNHLRPTELLGLTATPERLDGKDVTEWFDQRIAVELRLWEAIDQGFLVPFQYFGVADGTDLSQVTWRRGGYATEELSNVLSNDDLRVAKLLEAIQRIVLEPGAMRALGFCVSKEHAHYMARKFTEADSPASPSPATTRRPNAMSRLKDLGPAACAASSPSRFLARASTSPTSTASCSCARRLGDRLHAAARPRSAPRRRQEPPDRHRPHRSASPRVPLRGPSPGDRRSEARVDPRPGRGRLPVPARRCTVDLDRQSRESSSSNLAPPLPLSLDDTCRMTCEASQTGSDARRVPDAPRPPAGGCLPAAGGAGPSCAAMPARTCHRPQRIPSWRRER